MRRSYQEKVYFKNRTKNSLKAFINQKYFAVGCIKKTFFDGLNRSFVTNFYRKTLIANFYRRPLSLFSQIKETMVQINNLLNVRNYCKMIKKLLTN